MEIAFNNHYTIGILVFMFALLFCNNLLQCIQSCMQLWQTCALSACQECACLCPCVHHGHWELLRAGSLASLLVFSVGQPLLLPAVKMLGDALRHHHSFWTVNFVHVYLNVSAYPHHHSDHPSHDHQPDATVRLSHLAEQVWISVSEVDGLLLVLPFALCSACTTYTWASLQSIGHFKGDPAWDGDLFRERGLQMYELLYSLEVFLMMCTLFALAADPAPVDVTLLYAFAVTFIILFFAAQSRGRASAEGDTDRVLSMFLFALLSMLLCIFVGGHCSVDHPVKVASACMLVFIVFVILVLHLTTTDGTTAGHVILGRTLISCSCSLYVCVLLLADPNQ